MSYGIDIKLKKRKQEPVRVPTNDPSAVQAPEAIGGSVRLRVGKEFLELTPTAEYPILILQTDQYEAWIEGVVDLKTNARITGGVDKMRRGLMGDWKEVGDGVFELRLDFGPGYRIYYGRHGKVVIVLLGGGEKHGQQKDIADAQQLWGELRNEITQI